ncbi:diphthine--ammonia ligase [Algoriphagus sp. PAP.12]|uniref:Dph6-related ATP pyrophosphatase n=1 Tax=Algoriphagus sp. PAP.12 TaxID=2996678 RepID=UPI00227A04AA|nr:diphthine--ammonia ligase [Algoriphagus sp. PAP.12]
MDLKRNDGMIPVSMSWSGGKDSAMALWELIKSDEYQVVRLHTTFGEETRRVGMHGIPEELIEKQAESIGLPLDKLYYPASGDNTAYEKTINVYLNELEDAGIKHIGYGDILLEDLRDYREEKLAQRGFLGVFPLWKKDTRELIEGFFSNGFETKICAADSDLISKKWIGNSISNEFLNDLNARVDPCGENGEFHSYCYAGPIFQSPIEVLVGEITQKSYDIVLDNGEKGKKHFWFADIKKA